MSTECFIYIFKLHTATSRTYWHWSVRPSVRPSHFFVTTLTSGLTSGLVISKQSHTRGHHHHLCQHHCHLANQKQPQDLSYISYCMQLSKSFRFYLLIIEIQSMKLIRKAASRWSFCPSAEHRRNHHHQEKSPLEKELVQSIFPELP